MGAKGSGIPQAEQPQAIKAFRPQTSLYGLAIPLVYGTDRIAGNIAWVENFKAHAHNASSGSKKGGRVTNVQYTYTASVVLVLCEGPVYSLAQAMPGASRLSVNQQGRAAASRTFSPGVWKLKKILAPTTLHGTPNAGFWPFNGRLFTGAGWPTTGVDSATPVFPIVQGRLPPPDLGEGDGIYWHHMAQQFPDERQSFPGLCYAAGRNVPLDSNASLPSINWPITGLVPYFATYGLAAGGEQILDADPAQIILDVLTNRVHGLGQQTTLGHGWIDPGTAGSYLGDFFTGANSLSAWCRASEILISPTYDTAIAAAQLLEDLADLCDAALVWSGGRLKIIPYGDQVVSSTRTGVTYNPTVPSANPGGAYIGAVADLGPDDFQGTPLVKVTRKRAADVPNTIQIEFLNRTNAYAPEVAEAKDAAGIETGSGVIRNSPPRQMHAIKTAALARATAQRTLQREITVRAVHEFTLDWRWMLLEPMDVVTLTDPGAELDHWPVRLTTVDETADGSLTCTAEDLPVGARSTAGYGAQAATGRAIDYNEDAGALRPPVIWEAPFTAEDGRLVLQIAASGADNWGGAGIWLSEDGATYARVGSLPDASIHGRLETPLPAVDASPDTTSTPILQLEGEASLAAVDALAAQALKSALYVGRGNAYEIVAFTDATFLGLDNGRARYQLGDRIVRGAYQTAIAAHTVNDQVALVSSAVSVTLEPRLIGRKIYLKLQSQNVYGSGQPDLATIDPIEWKVEGKGLLAPPAQVANLREAFQDTHLALVWDPVTDPRPLTYEIRRGDAWATATLVARVTEPRWQLTGGGTYWIAARVVVETGRGAEVVYGTPTQATYDGAVFQENVIVRTDQAADAWPGVYDAYAHSVLDDGPGPLVYLRGGRASDAPGLDFSGHGVHATVGPGVTRVPGLIPGCDDLAYRFLGVDGAVTLWHEAANAARHLGKLGGYDVGTGVYAGSGWTIAGLLKRERLATAEVLFAGDTDAIPGLHPMLYIGNDDQLGIRTTNGDFAEDAGLYVDSTSVVYSVAWRFDGVTHWITVNGVTVEVPIGAPWGTVPWQRMYSAIWGCRVSGFGGLPLLGVMDELLLLDYPCSDDVLTDRANIVNSGAVPSVAYDPSRNAVVLAGGPLVSSYASVAAVGSFAYGNGFAPGRREGVYYLPPFHPYAVALGEDGSMRIDATAAAEGFPVFSSFGAAPSVADLEVVAGELGRYAEATLEVALATGRGASNEPDGARFGAWKPLVPGIYRASRAKFRVRLAATKNGVSARCTAATIAVDVPDVLDGGTATSAAGRVVRVGASAEVPTGGDTVIEIPLEQAVPVSGASQEHLIIAVAYGNNPGTHYGTASDDAGNTWQRDVAASPGAGVSALTPHVVLFSAKVTAALYPGQRLYVRGVPVDCFKAAMAMRVTGLASSSWFIGSEKAAGGTAGKPPGTYALDAGSLVVTPPRFLLEAWGLRTQVQAPDAVPPNLTGALVVPPTTATLVGTQCTRSTTPLGPFAGGLFDAAIAVAWEIANASPAAPVGRVIARGSPFFLGVQAAYALTGFSDFTRVYFNRRFSVPPTVSVAIEGPGGLSVPDQIEKANITTESFDVRIKNGGTVVSRSFTWTAQGF